MKTLVILNGECNSQKFLKKLSDEYDRVICADGGFLHAVSAGIKPDIVVGDFDSSELPTDTECVVFPKDKDLSDAEIAIEYAIRNYGKNITLTCALGKRLDHQMFNVFLLSKYPFIRIEEYNVIVFLCEANKNFSEFENKTISFFPVERANITLKNFKYNISDFNIKFGETTTLSNIALKNASLQVNNGRVFSIINKTD